MGVCKGPLNCYAESRCVFGCRDDPRPESGQSTQKADVSTQDACSDRPEEVAGRETLNANYWKAKYEAAVSASGRSLLDDLEAVVQYHRKDEFDPWVTMAAFDLQSVAERYAQQCGEGDVPWEYRVVPIDKRKA